MTFQPPPPPPPPPGGQPNQPYGAPPPAGPPPAGQWGTPPPAPMPGHNASGSFDPKTVNQLDWGILGAGVFAFIFSLFDYYTVSVSFGGQSASASASAWHGFFGWFAALLAIVGSAAVALEIFSPSTKLPFPNRLVGLGSYAVATLCVILALFVFPGGDYTGAGVDEGHGFGYWVSLIVIIAGLVLSLMRFQQSGGVLPGALSKMPNIGAKGPGGTPPPPPGYGTPPPPPGYGQQPPPPPGYGQQPPPPPGYGPPR